MSKIQDEISVNFDLSKREINNEDIEEVIKPKPKRASKKNDVVEDVNPVIEEPIQTVEEVIKPKPKRTSKKSNIVVEDINIKPIEPEPVKEIDDIEEIPKNIKTLEQVECEKCNKKMTKNTLRYHHEKNCKGEPIDTKAIPVKRRIIKPEPKVEPKIEAKQPTYRDKLNERLKKRSESISKLALQIA